MSEKINPHGDNVLVEIVDQTKTAGGIHIPDRAKGNQRDAIIGKVIAVGKGRLTEYGVKILPEATEGSYVLIPRGAGTEIELDTRSKNARKVRLLRDVEILGDVEEKRILELGIDVPADVGKLVLP